MELGLKDCKAIEKHAFRGLQNMKTLFLHQNIAKKWDKCEMVIHITKLQELTFFPGSIFNSLTLNTPNLKEFFFHKFRPKNKSALYHCTIHSCIKVN